MEYRTTKERCQQIIDNHGNVCSGCGGKLTAIETVDNSDNPTHWSGCEKCQQFDNGTKENVYKIAVKMVDERNFTAYNFDPKPSELTDKDQFDYWRKSQIRGTSSIVSDILNFNKEIVL
jgi:hypothetical protein